jgi:hypothetical protein
VCVFVHFFGVFMLSLYFGVVLEAEIA